MKSTYNGNILERVMSRVSHVLVIARSCGDQFGGHLSVHVDVKYSLVFFPQHMVVILLVFSPCTYPTFVPPSYFLFLLLTISIICTALLMSAPVMLKNLNLLGVPSFIVNLHFVIS